MKGKGRLHRYFLEKSTSVQERVDKREGNRFEKKIPELPPLPEEEPHDPAALNSDNQPDTVTLMPQPFG